jgi:hypothetical protein
MTPANASTPNTSRTYTSRINDVYASSEALMQLGAVAIHTRERGSARELLGESLRLLHRAERHVANIIRKLGVASRTQVAAWAFDHLGAPARA